ncbi:MAG: hypothetical protein AAGF47_01075 [Planctomycetota bacterium]
MLSRRSIVVVAVIALAVVAIALIFRVVGKSPPDATPPPSPYRIGETAAFASRSDTTETLDAIAVKLESEAEGVTDPASAAILAAMATERLRFMLEPDLETWESLVTSQGGVVESPSGLDEAEYMKRWHGLANRYKGSAISADGVTIRRAVPGEEQSLGGPGSRFLRGDSTLSGRYPDIDPEAEAVDVFLPAQYTLDSGRRIDCTLVFRYTNAENTGVWAFGEVFAYFGEDSMSVALNQPLN